MTPLVACRGCDLLLGALHENSATLSCPRCGSFVRRFAVGQGDTALCACLTAGIAFVLANCFPVVAIEAAGNRAECTLLGAALALQSQHMGTVAFVVATTTVVIPSTDLICTFGMLLLARTPRSGNLPAVLFRLRELLRPWNMVEIFVLGALVALVKLHGLASVIPGIGMWSLAAFVISSAMVAHAFDPFEFWYQLGTRR